MNIDKGAIEEFREIYKKEFQEELPYEEAALMANELLEFYSLIIPNPKPHGKPPNDQ